MPRQGAASLYQGPVGQWPYGTMASTLTDWLARLGRVGARADDHGPGSANGGLDTYTSVDV